MKKNNIFVGNLAFSTTREEVMAICQTHGTVVSIRMRKNSGYALVEMASAEQAQAVIDNLDGKDRGGRAIKVTFEISAKKAKPKAVDTFKKNKEAGRLEYRKKLEKTRDTGFGKRKPAGKRGDFRNNPRKGAGRRGGSRFEPRDDFHERKQPGRRDSFERKESFGNRDRFVNRDFGQNNNFRQGESRSRDDFPGNRPPFRKDGFRKENYRNDGDRPGFKKPFNKGPGFGKSSDFRKDSGFGKPRRPGTNDRGPNRRPDSRGPRRDSRRPRPDSRGPRR